MAGAARDPHGARAVGERGRRGRLRLHQDRGLARDRDIARVVEVQVEVKLRSRGKLHPKQVDNALDDMRTALLEAVILGDVTPASYVTGLRDLLS